MLLCLMAGGTAAAQAGDPPVRVDSGEAVRQCLTPAEQRRPIASLTPAQRRRLIGCINAAAARQINAQLPTQIDDITRLDRVTTEGPQLTYHYSVARRLADLPAGIGAGVERSTRTHVCAQPQMTRTMAMGGAYAYRWVDADRTLIHQMRITSC